MVKAKICGITNLDDALASAGAGCEALGFVFYKKSPRYIPPEEAREIIRQLPGGIIKIGVFVNEKEQEVRRIAGLCGLDMLQFHGNESPEFCERFKDRYKVIKAFRVKRCINRKRIARYKPFAFLFDTFSPSSAGGTGKRFDWRLIRHIDELKCPVFLSGGLTAKNVKEAIKCVKPEWVDVSSSVEKKPGEKDQEKVRKFIKAVNKYGIQGLSPKGAVPNIR